MRNFIDHILRPYRAIKQWYQNHFVMFVELCAETEHTYISKCLWQKISADHEDSNEYTIFFEKYTPHYHGSHPLYRFFVNADLSEVATPDGEPPYTCNIQLSRFGHMGFQCVQPTPIEVLTEYGIADEDFIHNHFSCRVRFRIKRYLVAGKITYELKPSPILITHNS